MERKLLSTGEVGEMVGVTDSCVRIWIRQGRLAARRTPGGQYRVDMAELAKFLTATKR